MAKSLGQLHVVNFSKIVNLGAPGIHLIDSSSELSKQLQRNIRQMSTYKCTGININMSCDPQSVIDVDQLLVTGKIRYFSPTRGRVAAMKAGYSTVMRAMKNQGISKNNKLYDFRITPKLEAYYEPNSSGDDAFTNLATLNGSDPLTLLDNPLGTLEITSLFDAHNSNIAPLQTGTPTFGGGLSQQFQPVAPNDYVLNEGLIHEGRTMYADEKYEYIPFTCEYDPVDSGKSALQFEWQPDPQLYLSVLGGWFEIEFDQISAGFDMPLGISADLEVAIEFSGWKSILGTSKPRRSKKKSRRTKRKSRR